MYVMSSHVGEVRVPAGEAGVHPDELQAFFDHADDAQVTQVREAGRKGSLCGP